MSGNACRPLSILSVEDDAADFSLIRTYARLSGLVNDREAEERVAWAKTLAEGEAIARASKPDIVLLDLSLPDSDGLATVQAMQAVLPNVPIVVLTGLDDNALATAVLQAGAQDYLVKGKIDHDALGRVVRHAIVREVLETRLRLFEAALDSVASGIVITDVNTCIEWVNPAFTRLTGFWLDEAMGFKLSELAGSGKHDEGLYCSIQEATLSGLPWCGEIVSRRKDGAPYNASLNITPVSGAEGAIQHLVAIMQDITERKQTEEKISRLAFHDSLTKLPNRRLLKDRLEQAMIASKRSGRYGAVMLMDLDKFKPLNDAHGHAAGDLLLIEVSHRLIGCVREIDTVARFGGDEFVVVLSELDVDRVMSAEQAGAIAEKIRAALFRPCLLKTRFENKMESTVKHHCTGSIGVSLFYGHDASPDDVIKQADVAMYKAKVAGRNSIRFYEAKAGEAVSGC